MKLKNDLNIFFFISVSYRPIFIKFVLSWKAIASRNSIFSRNRPSNWQKNMRSICFFKTLESSVTDFSRLEWQDFRRINEVWMWSHKIWQFERFLYKFQFYSIAKVCRVVTNDIKCIIESCKILMLPRKCFENI